MKPLLLIVFIFHLSPDLFCQGIEADTLPKNFSQLADTTKVRTLLHLSDKFRQSEINKSISYGEQGLKLAKAIRDQDGEMKALNNLSTSYLNTNNKQKALEYEMQWLLHAQNLKNEFEEARALQMMGTTYEFLGGYPEALKNYFAALRLFEKHKDTPHIANSYTNVAHIFLKEQNDSAAMQYFHNALHLLQSQRKKEYGNLTQLANDIGDYYKSRREYERAIEYFKRALDFANQIPSKYKSHAVTMVLINMGEVFQNKNDFGQALSYNQKALALAEQSESKSLLGLSYEHHAQILENMDSLQSANEFYQKAASAYKEMNMESRLSIVYNAISRNYQHIENFPLANQYALMALELSEGGDLPISKENALKNLVAINEKSGKFQQALMYQKQLQKLKDTLLNEEKVNNLNKLEVLYEADKKQEEIRMLRLQKEKEITLRYLLLGSIVFILILGIMAYRTQRIRRKKDRQIHSSQKELMEERLKNVQIHEQQLQDEIENKNKELTGYSLNFIQKNQLLEEVKSNIKEIRKNAGDQVANQLSHLNRLINRSFNLDKDWNEFHLYFENVHDRFFKELSTRFPDLTNKDLRLSALLKLNLSSKEIATLTGISPSSVKMARYRLRKKLGLDSEEDLVAFLIQLEKVVSTREG